MAEKKQEDGVTEIQNAISKTEAFIEKNRKTLIYVIVGVIAVACLIFPGEEVLPGAESGRSTRTSGERCGIDGC